MDDKTLFLAATPLTLILAIGMLFLAWSRADRRYVLYWASTNIAGLLGAVASRFAGETPDLFIFTMSGPVYFLSVYCTFVVFAVLGQAERFRRPVFILLLI